MNSRCVWGVLLCWGLVFPDGALAQGSSPGAAAAVLRLLQSGRLPPERQGPALRLLCQRGGPRELAFAFQVALDPKRPAEQRAEVLRQLALAARQRRVRPQGDLTQLGQLLQGKEPLPVVQAAIHLAGVWALDTLAPKLALLAQDAQAPPPLRRTAIEALQRMPGKQATQSLLHLARSSAALSLRFQAAGALVARDPAIAAQVAAELIPLLNEDVELKPLLQPFLDQRGGSQQLAQALQGKALSGDVARLVLRYLYSVGRSDAELVRVLGQAAGIDLSKPPFGEKDIPELVAEVQQHGDPARGELVFRRKELSCVKCHAINGVGGNIGPDLGPLGASSPVDYILRSILFPSQAIKEQYKTRVIITSQGQIITGIQVSRDERKVVLKTAEGELRSVPVADIEEEAEGRSLMPEGLTRFLTRKELVDLVAFLSRLGKPGPWAIPQTPVIRRWEVLLRPRPEVVQQVPDPFLLQKKVRQLPKRRWQSVLALVSGHLPLSEAVQVARSEVLYLRGYVNVIKPGRAQVMLNSTQGVHAWLDGEPLPLEGKAVVELSAGRHELLFRVDTRRSAPSLRVELKPLGAAIQPVGGS